LFKIDDTVIVIQSSGSRKLTIDHQYLVLDTKMNNTPGQPAIQLVLVEHRDGTRCWYSSKRFEKAPSIVEVQVGDMVECVNALYKSGITLGKQYQVLEVFKTDFLYFMIKNDTGIYEQYYLSSRFKKVEPVVEPIEETFEAGDTVECIDNTSVFLLTYGKLYKVQEVSLSKDYEELGYDVQTFFRDIQVINDDGHFKDYPMVLCKKVEPVVEMFKVGDTVECIDNKDVNRLLTVRKLYNIKSINEGFSKELVIVIDNTGAEAYFFPDRFRKVDLEEKVESFFSRGVDMTSIDTRYFWNGNDVTKQVKNLMSA